MKSRIEKNEGPKEGPSMITGSHRRSSQYPWRSHPRKIRSLPSAMFRWFLPPASMYATTTKGRSQAQNKDEELPFPHGKPALQLPFVLRTAAVGPFAGDLLDGALEVSAGEPVRALGVVMVKKMKEFLDT